MDWKPIETAPRDGTPVLLGYLDQSGKFAVRSAQWQLVHPRNADKPWARAWVCTMNPILVDSRATHWAVLEAPIPEPSFRKHTEGRTDG